MAVDAASHNVSLEPAHDADFDSLVAIRIAAMRESLERVGRFDPSRARERFASTFVAEDTRHVVVDGVRVGVVVVRRMSSGLKLDHLYIDPARQRTGIGSRVLELVFAEADALGLGIHVSALRGSASNQFYRRHGFEYVDGDALDLNYFRPA